MAMQWDKMALIWGSGPFYKKIYGVFFSSAVAKNAKNGSSMDIKIIINANFLFFLS